MTTAIIGVGNVGSAVATDLVNGGEPVVIANRHQDKAEALAGRLGDLASVATIREAISQADAVLLALYLDPEQKIIRDLSRSLAGKVVIDPSNPVGPDGHGGFARTLPDDQSAGEVIADLLPSNAHYVKAFSSVGADALASAPNRKPDRAVLFYATDDDVAADTAESLIRISGFDPVKVGGLDKAGRIEMLGGDLQQITGLNGRLLDLAEARAAI